MPREHIHFITGKLAADALRAQVERLAAAQQFDFSIGVLPITVAALMTCRWVARHWQIPPEATRVILPGYCSGDLATLPAEPGRQVERGPRDLRQLPRYLGHPSASRSDYGAYDIQILAEINHAPRLAQPAILQIARRLAADGADLIDLGCEPGGDWTGVGDCVRALRDAGLRVSIDSLMPDEIAAAVQAGAELVLSVNSSNRAAAVDWGVEVVAIPDDPATGAGLADTVEWLDRHGVPCRLDPILEPLGCGFAASLGRYLETRRAYPQAEMLMGIGNVTELTDADSAPLNTLLLGFCQEVGIRSVLTTQVIPWAQSSVRECDLARRLVHYATRHRVPPKHLAPELVLLRDPDVPEFGPEFLAQLSQQIRDANYRIYAEQGRLHLLAAGLHLEDTDPFRLFRSLLATSPKNLDAGHAFYLGYELAKATTATTLGKAYRQDEALDWGFLTVVESSLRARPGHGAEDAEASADRPEQPAPPPDL